jgi:protein SCO1
MIRSIKSNVKSKLIWLWLLASVSCTEAPTNASNLQKNTDSLPFINKPDFTPEWINPTDAQYAQIHTIPAFSFINQEGETITEKTVENKIYIANFMFTSCVGICPKMTENMRTLQTYFKDDKNILLLSHSVLPQKDNVSVLKEYATRKDIKTGKWHLLTGDVKNIYSIAKKEYFAGEVIGYYGQQSDFLHTENFILIDKFRRIRGVYNGTLPIEMERLITDIETLKKE